MKKLFLSLLALAVSVWTIQAQSKVVTRTGHATIFSHTIAEDITGHNYEVSGAINPATGEVVISVPVQSFQFEKALMQEHFNNSNFMDSKQYPRITLKGKIDNLSSVNFSKDGKYEVTVTGELTIKGTTKPITEKATIEVNGGKISVNSSFVVKDIGSYGVGKPKGGKKNNVADAITVTYVAAYEKE